MEKSQLFRFSDATSYWKWNLYQREPGWKFVQILVEIEKIKETDKFLQAFEDYNCRFDQMYQS